jgi:hypothetical protein
LISSTKDTYQSSYRETPKFGKNSPPSILNIHLSEFFLLFYFILLWLNMYTFKFILDDPIIIWLFPILLHVRVRSGKARSSVWRGEHYVCAYKANAKALPQGLVSELGLYLSVSLNFYRTSEKMVMGVSIALHLTLEKTAFLSKNKNVYLL